MNYSRFIPAPKNFYVYLSRMLLKEVLHIDYKIKIKHYNQKLFKASQIVDKKTREIYTQTEITFLDLIFLNGKSEINFEENENDKLNNSDNIAQNTPNDEVTSQENNTAQVKSHKILSDSANEGLNNVNEVSNSNEFFRVSKYSCTPPKH